MYSGPSGSKLMAWLSLSYCPDSPRTDAHTLGICCSQPAEISFFRPCPPCTDHARGSRQGKPLLTWRERATWRVPPSPGLGFAKYRVQKALHPASIGRLQRTHRLATDQPLQIFSNCFDHDLEDGILFPFFFFFSQLISLSIMHLRRLHCPTILLFTRQKNIFVNGSIISAVSLLVHRKFPFWTGTHSFCCTIVHFMACHTKKK